MCVHIHVYNMLEEICCWGEGKKGYIHFPLPEFQKKNFYVDQSSIIHHLTVCNHFINIIFANILSEQLCSFINVQLQWILINLLLHFSIILSPFRRANLEVFPGILLWCSGLRLRCFYGSVFDSWPQNFYMPQAQLKNKKYVCLYILYNNWAFVTIHVTFFIKLFFIFPEKVLR